MLTPLETKIALAVLCLGVIGLCAVVAMLAGSDFAERRRKRRRRDPVEQAYADTVGMALDVEPAPATDELPPVDAAEVDALVMEIGRAQIRNRFRNIYGEDGQA